MAYVSELMNRPVTDPQGRQIGVVKDLVARERKEYSHHPVIEAVEVDQHGQTIIGALWGCCCVAFGGCTSKMQ